ncbi:DUF1684 domain-containing protein [Amycolatopsis sp. cg5]|uniref:DUF1684 domain-containing protein n=1 Tax=Amycolatopsis sp. cg5 TaxID=3238802 RepID=UPI0035253C7D
MKGFLMDVEYAQWLESRREEIAGKAKVVGVARVSGSHPAPGEWPTGAGLTVTTTPAGADGGYGLIVTNDKAPAPSGVDTYAYDPAWVFEGEYREATAGRRIEVGRLTSPRSTEAIASPVDLVVTIGGTEYTLAVLEDMPGQRLVVFTDETSGTETPAIGRWLVLPQVEPGSPVMVDFNRATLSYHHLSPAVFTCPLSPPGNSLPLRVEAGERALVYDLGQKAIAFLRHLEKSEWTAARALCAGSATVWHNDGKGQASIDETMRSMAAQSETIESMRYDITRQLTGPDEVLQQHAVRVTTKDGTRGSVHAAAYFRFEDGLITRIEEYANFVPDES